MVVPCGFEECLRSVLAAESSALTRRIARRCNIYAGGSRDENIYFIVAGQVKVIMQSPAGKECLLAIYTTGDFFGENCLSRLPRTETATAMSDSVIKQVSGPRFLTLMLETGMVGALVRSLAERLAEQQQVITNLATLDCEYRLAATLLRLCRKVEAGESPGMTKRISHQELSQMVGTTRPRVSEFMQRFRDRGLIELTPDSRILVRERCLRKYLETRELEPRVTAAAS